MTKLRSPNYPNHDLRSALDLARKIYSREDRNAFSRDTVARDLSHAMLSGPALGKIGALRSYGLIEGVGNELRMSEDAITALVASENSSERKVALSRLASRPTLFQDIKSEFSEKPPLKKLGDWLVEQGFSLQAASIAARSYLGTVNFLIELGIDRSGEDNRAVAAEVLKTPIPEAGIDGQRPVITPPFAGEREWIRGPLSRDVTYRIFVSGELGPKEVGKLIKVLEAQRAVLSDDIN